MKIGPAQAISKTFTDVTDLNYDFDSKVVEISVRGQPPIQIDIDAAATITHTISAKQHTVAIS
jgi:hypothetical protein